MISFSQKILPAGAPMGHGAVAFINESDMMQGTYSQALTNYIVSNPEGSDLRAAREFIAPSVEVPPRFEFKKSKDDAFYADTTGDDIISIGGDFKKIKDDRTTVDASTKNYGLTTVIFHDKVRGLPMWRERAVTSLRNRCLRNSYRRLVTAIAAASTNQAYTWDTSAGKDPDADLQTEYLTGLIAKGLPPNRALFGMISWAKRVKSLRAQSSAAGFAGSGMTPQELAQWLGIQEVRISTEVYNTAADTKTKIVPDIVLLFNAQPSVSIDDPSGVKRFWSRCEDGQEERVFIQEGMKSTQIWFEYYEYGLVVESTGMRKLTIS